VELARLLAGPAEAADVLLVPVEAVNPVLPVPVGDVDAPVGRDGDRGWLELVLLLVLARLVELLERDRPYHGAVELELQGLLALEVGAVEELLAALVV